MLLLYRRSVQKRNFLVLFTFHYASTLSPMMALYSRTGRIYIPLCFYFILALSPVFDLHDHLHSTMLLLYRYLQKLVHGFAVIYIPLCFYFICDSVILRPFFSYIYIPLCFYFIHHSVFSRACDRPIYIPLCFYFIDMQVEGDNITFSIYIPLCFYFIHHPSG